MAVLPFIFLEQWRSLIQAILREQSLRHTLCFRVLRK